MNETSHTAPHAALTALGIVLPSPAAPAANYVGAVVSGHHLYVSGQLALNADGKLDGAFVGKLGDAISEEIGQKAARLCAVNVLAQANAALGSLERITRVVRLGGFINVVPGFTAVPRVMNGASDLMVAVFGERGRHARSTIGVAELPFGCCVEVEGLFEFQ